MRVEPMIAAAAPYGIPTRYADVQFRSRLEATWAAFFDEIGWRWTYEPYDLAGWIPDFVLHLSSPVLVEVKPEITIDGLKRHAAKIDAANPEHEVLLVGADLIEHPTPSWSGVHTALGLLCELPYHWWQMAPMVRCNTCASPGFSVEYGSYHLRTCGHRDSGRDDDDGDRVRQSFAIAKNRVQWRGRVGV